MNYDTPQAFRIALEQRLLNQSQGAGISLDRLRRRVMFERIVARLTLAEPRRWVLKGGMALEVRLRDAARLTKDIDLGLRSDAANPASVHELLVEALAEDPYHDGFVFMPRAPTRLVEGGVGGVTLRSKVAVHLAGKRFGGIQIDVSPRAYELDETEVVPLPNSLAFAGVGAPDIEIIDLHRHAAEKCHAMLKDLDGRENTRARDLVDLVILCEHDHLVPSKLRRALEEVWREREAAGPPRALPPLPPSWPPRYERAAEDNHLRTASFSDAVDLVTALWVSMFDKER